MSIAVMSWAWTHSKAEGADLLVLLAIADHAQDNGSGAFPSVKTLSLKARVSERTVQRCVRSLVDLNELTVKVGAGRNGANLYTVRMGANSSPRQDVTPSESRGDTNAGVTNEVPRGDTHVTGGVTPVSPEPSFNHQEPSTLVPAKPKRSPFPARTVAAFDEFWKFYPRKDAKGDALKAFDKATKAGTASGVIILAAKRYAADPNLPEPKYIPQARSWLNGGRWEDGPLPDLDGKAAPADLNSWMSA